MVVPPHLQPASTYMPFAQNNLLRVSLCLFEPESRVKLVCLSCEPEELNETAPLLKQC